MLYPKGVVEGKGNSISAFLCLDESTLPPDTKVLVTFAVRVLDLDQTRQKPENFESKGEFSSRRFFVYVDFELINQLCSMPV